jgi:multicomponent K+:H+ antiporter subunit G
MADYLIAAVLVIGGIFGLIGSFGLLKLNDPMKRLHAPTKASTIGVGTALIASSIYAAVHGGALSLQEILIVIFLFITSPITAHFLSKAHLHRNLSPRDVPPTGTGREWATFEADGQTRDNRSILTDWSNF